MPALADARPDGLNVTFRPGNTFVLTLNWPAGQLAGRTFESTLDGDPLTVGIVGDVMTITVTEAQTAAIVGTVKWLLTETTGGETNDHLIGKWTASTNPGSGSSGVVAEVTESGVVIDVTVLGSAGPAAASQVTTTPAGSIASTNVQDALKTLSGVLQLDIRNYGASLSAARAGIQLALDTAEFAAAAGATAVVWVPPGTWQIDNGASPPGEAIVVPNGVTLRGAGVGRSVLRMDSSTSVAGGGVVSLGASGAASSDIVVEHLTIDGNQAGQDTNNRRHGIVHNSNLSLRNIWLRNLVIRNCGHYGIGLQGNGFVGENIYIEDVAIENVRGDGIDIKSQGTKNCHIRNISVFYFGTDPAFSAQSGLDLRGTWTVEGVDIRSVANNVHTDHAGIRFRQSGGTAPQVPPLRAGAVGCVVRGVTVALTGAVVTEDVAEGTGASAGSYAAIGNVVDTVAHRRANVVNELNDGSLTDAPSHVTASITPRPNVLYLLAVQNSSGTSATQPTVTGCGFTWTLVRSRAHNATNRLSLFSAMGYSASPPTTGQLTIDFGGVDNVALWRLDAVENVSLISDADAVVQSADNTVSSGTALAVTLAAFNHTENSTYSVFGTWTSTTPPTAESGYMQSPGDAAFGNRILSTIWRPGSDTTPGVTHAGATMTGIGCELRTTRP